MSRPKTRLERALEDDLIEAVKKAGGYALKMPAMFYTGIPDRLLLLPGRVVFVEVKRDSDHQPSEAQLGWRRKIRKLKIEHYILDHKDQIKEIV